MKNIFKLASVFMAIALLVSTLLLTGALVSAGEKNLLTNGDFKVLPDLGAAKPYDVEGFGWKDGGIIAGESTFAEGSFTLKNGNSGAKGFYQDIAFDTETEYTLTLNVTVTSGTLDVRLYDSTGKSNLKSVVKYDAGTVGEQTVKFTPVDGAARIYLGGSNVLFTITSAVLTDGTTEETTTASASETEATVTEVEPTATEAEPTATEAEPTATATEATSAPTAPEVNGDKVIARWTTPAQFDGTSTNISIKPDKVTGNDGTEDMLFSAFASAHFTEMYATDNYVEIAVTGDFSNLTGTPAYAGNLFSKALTVGNGTTDTLTYSKTDSKIVFSSKTVGLSKKSNLGSNGKIDITGLVGVVFGAGDTLTFTIYEKGAETTATEATGTEATEATGTEATEATGTEATEATGTEATEATGTEASVTETKATETEASATETRPMVLAENVLFEDTVGNTKTLKAGKTDAWFLVVNEVKADIAANGPIDPDKGEYYQITVTGSVDAGEADFHMGEDADWNEYWGKSGSITTEPSTVTATIPVAIPDGLTGKVYLADSGEDGHTLTWTYAKVSVFRLGAAPETSATATETATEASVTETEASATETEASATETATEASVTETEASATETATEASATETEASATETKASATETEASATETEPAATETGTDVAIYGDANGDGVVNLKDVLAARKYVAGIETEIDLVASDVNKDDVVNMKDILLIRKFIAGLITSFDA